MVKRSVSVESSSKDWLVFGADSFMRLAGLGTFVEARVAWVSVADFDGLFDAVNAASWGVNKWEIMSPTPYLRRIEELRSVG